MTYTVRTYTAADTEALSEGLVPYEVISVGKKDREKVEITVRFRIKISESDIDGSVICTECIRVFNLVRMQLMAKTGEQRVTVAAKDEFKVFLATRYAAYVAELAAKTVDNTEIAKIETDLRGAVSDVFA